MSQPKLKFMVDAPIREQAAQHYKEGERLPAIKLSMSGQYTFDEISKIIGRLRSVVQLWLIRFVTEGIEGSKPRLKLIDK